MVGNQNFGKNSLQTRVNTNLDFITDDLLPELSTRYPQSYPQHFKAILHYNTILGSLLLSLYHIRLNLLSLYNVLVINCVIVYLPKFLFLYLLSIVTVSTE